MVERDPGEGDAVCEGMLMSWSLLLTAFGISGIMTVTLYLMYRVRG